jgi:hypothetical protein
VVFDVLPVFGWQGAVQEIEQEFGKIAAGDHGVTSSK